MKSLHGNTQQQPYHLSVIAIPLDDKNQVYCHYFEHFQHSGVMNGEPLNDFYMLMSESLEDGESPEAALRRGLMEEMGATAEITAFLGADEIKINDLGMTWLKTRAFYLCELVSANPSKRLVDDPEAGSQLGWYDIDKVKRAMKVTAAKYQRNDGDYTDAIDRAVGQRKRAEK